MSEDYHTGHGLDTGSPRWVNRRLISLPRVISTADLDVQNDEQNLVFIPENSENYAMGYDELWRGPLDALR